MPTKTVTKADLRVFAEALMAHIGQPPANFEQIVEEAIKDFKEKEKEA